MATKIVTKNSSTGGAVPSASDLVQGELAVNVADKRLFTEDNGGSIVELGTNPSTIDINAGSIDGTAIGASSASTGAFTTLTATGLTVDTDTLYVDSTNNRVGIGTTSPAESIHTAGNIRLGDSAPAELYTNSSELRFGVDKNNDNGTSNITFYVDNSEKVRIDSSGNVGIGTSAIMQDFGGGRTTLALKGAGSTDYSTLQLGNYGTSSNGQIHGLINFYDGTTSVSRIQSVRASNTSDAHLAFYTAPSSGGITERMRIDSSGNVGIGASPNASADLHVADTSDARIWLDATSGDTMELYAGTNVSLFNRSNNAVTFGTNNTERMRIDSSGNVGIGTTSPSTRLTVGAGSGSEQILVDAGAGWADLKLHSDATNGGSIYFNDGADAGQIFYYHPDNTMRFHTNASERARLDSSGNLMVGKTAVNFTTLGAELRSNGQINCGSTADFLNMFSTSASAYRFYVTNAGTIKATNTTISAISDQRFKENIRDLDDGLSKVMELRPRKFDWKEGKGADIKDDRGFIAQEFEQVFPDLVGEWKDEAPEGEEPYKAVSQDLIPTLVKAIQEQQTLIESLTARIAALEE